MHLFEEREKENNFITCMTAKIIISMYAMRTVNGIHTKADKKEREYSGDKALSRLL